jgi:hypothetical protein
MIWEIIVELFALAWKLLKWGVLLMLLFGFSISSYCQRAVNSVCETSMVCTPNYARVEWFESGGKKGSSSCSPPNEPKSK